MILTKGANVLFINDPAKDPLLFTQQAADFSTNPNAATQDGTTGNVLQIQGLIARIKLGAITGEVRAIRPVPRQNAIVTIDPADPTQIDLQAFTPGAVVRFVLLTDLNYGSQIEFWRGMPGERSEFGRENYFSVKLRTGDTETTVLQRLVNGINDHFTTNFGEYPFKADFGVTNAGKFTLQGTNSDIALKILAFDDALGSPSTLLVPFAPVRVQDAFEGVGIWETLQATYRLETEASREPYSLQQFDRIQKGGRYTGITFFTKTERPDLVANELTDSPVNASRNEFNLYVLNGADGEAFLTKLLNYLQRAAADVTKVYRKKDGTELATPGSATTAGSFLADV